MGHVTMSFRSTQSAEVLTLLALLLIFPGFLESTLLVETKPEGSVSSSGNNSYNYSRRSCICDGDCERVVEQDCPWGLTLDFCGCCLLCSRGEGEPCGGALGTCAQGLHCVNESERRGEGTCSRVRADEVKVCSKPVRRFGCLFHGGNCVCENHTVCPGIEMFLFDTEESCRSRIAILMARQDNIQLATSKPQQQSSECSRVKCPKIEECPPDSYRLPTSVHQDPSDCCPTVEKCQCSPGQLCPKPECPTGWIEKLILNATGEPGNCCPLLECSPNQSEESSICSYDGEEYEPGETWTHHEDCSQCSCSSVGVVTCQKIQCDIPKECRLARAPSDSCCPQCVGCITSAGKVYNNSHIWEEDACTLCECVEGRIKCHAAMCRVQCENPIHIPGECCPRCEPEFQECPALACRDLACPHGFRVDNKGCPTCQCNKCPPLLRDDCLLSCPFGYDTDPLGCPVCSCRTSRGELEAEVGRRGSSDHGSIPLSSGGQLPPTLLQFRRTNNDARAGASRNVENGTTVGVGKSCKSVDDKEGVTLRAEGDEWSDGCHHCVCKFGLEMCSLITCSPPDCENPVSYPGDCCPRCPDPELPQNHHKNPHVNASICSQSPNDPWKVSDCLTCTCHHGLTFCSSPLCPPTPCENPTPSSCCSTCPGNGTNSSPEQDEANRNCFSEDTNTEHFHGETWKMGPCKSCRCQDGKIECFSSSGSCPRLTCDQPVIARNQCCPICLDEGEKMWTKMNCSLIGSNDTWSHGQSWTVDKCTRCVCLAPLVQCTKVVCSISCKKSLIYDEDKCCPICPEDHHEILVDGKLTSDLHKKHAGLEPYCAVLIALLLATTCVLAFFLLRVVYRRRRRRRLNDKSLSSSSSSCTNRDYCYFNNNRKNECSTGFSSSNSSQEGSVPEKKLLCPPNV